MSPPVPCPNLLFYVHHIIIISYLRNVLDARGSSFYLSVAKQISKCQNSCTSQIYVCVGLPYFCTILLICCLIIFKFSKRCSQVENIFISRSWFRQSGTFSMFLVINVNSPRLSVLILDSYGKLQTVCLTKVLSRPSRRISVTHSQPMRSELSAVGQ